MAAGGGLCKQAHLDFETDVFELEGIPQAEAEVEVLQVESIILEYVKPGHSIAQQALGHGRGAKRLEDGSHIGSEGRAGARADGSSLVLVSVRGSSVSTRFLVMPPGNATPGGKRRGSTDAVAFGVVGKGAVKSEDGGGHDGECLQPTGGSMALREEIRCEEAF